MDPGAALTETFPIFYGGQGWTFDAVGTYELTARYRLDGGNEVRHVVSEPVRITVIDGGPASRLLLESVKDTREAGRFLLWQAGDHLRRGTALLKELIERHPNTQLAEYAELAFAESLSRDFRDYSIGRVRQADCDRALERFGKVREDVPPAYLRVQKQLSEARCLIKTGRQQEAAQRVSTAKKLAASRPDMRRLFDAASMLEPTMKTLY